MNWKLTVILYLLLFIGCKNVSTEREELAKAELLLENAPDSALLILDDIRTRSGLPDDIKASATLLTAKAKLRKGESFLTSGRTRGDMDVVTLKPSWQVNIGTSKSMKNWFFQLQATDIFRQQEVQ